MTHDVPDVLTGDADLLYKYLDDGYQYEEWIAHMTAPRNSKQSFSRAWVLCRGDTKVTVRKRVAHNNKIYFSKSVVDVAKIRERNAKRRREARENKDAGGDNGEAVDDEAHSENGDASGENGGGHSDGGDEASGENGGNSDAQGGNSDTGANNDGDDDEDGGARKKVKLEPIDLVNTQPEFTSKHVVILDVNDSCVKCLDLVDATGSVALSCLEHTVCKTCVSDTIHCIWCDKDTTPDPTVQLFIC